MKYPGFIYIILEFDHVKNKYFDIHISKPPHVIESEEIIFLTIFFEE